MIRYPEDIKYDKIIAAAVRDGRIKVPTLLNRLGFGKKGYYSVYLVLDEDPPIDYHWYRQDKGGLWSQKHGLSYITRIDGSQERLIRNPLIANHNYNHLQPGIHYSSRLVLLWVKVKK